MDVRVGVRGDLRKVGHAQHLGVAGERPQARPDRVGHSPPDAGVDLVEDEGPAGRLGRIEHLDRQHHAGEFAARGDPRQRTRCLAGVGRQQEFRAIDAGGGPLPFATGLLEAERTSACGIDRSASSCSSLAANGPAAAAPGGREGARRRTR